MSKDLQIRKLTDAVFGFALAVGALSLTAANPNTMTDVAGGLVSFSLSFTILVVIWWGTSDTMSRLNYDRTATVVLNVVLLFFVAVEPYLLNILNTSASLFPLSSTLYALDMCFLMGVSGGLCHILLKENKGILSERLQRFYTMRRNSQFAFAGLFLLSTLPPFLELTIGGISSRILIWFTTLGLSLTTSARTRKRQAQNGGF